MMGEVTQYHRENAASSEGRLIEVLLEAANGSPMPCNFEFNEESSTVHWSIYAVVSFCHGIHPRSLDTDWNQACTAGRSTTPIPILISPDDYPVAERIHTSI
jgi:hypothetical protein